MGVKEVVAIIGLAITLGGLVWTANDTFVTMAQASELFNKASLDREIGDLETQRALAEHEKEFLIEKPSRTELDQQRIAYLVDRIRMLDERLMKLRSIQP